MLGVDLCQELRKDYEVYGADLVTRALEHKSTRFIKTDVTEKKNISDVLKKVCPDIVIHTAAYTDVDGCEINFEKAYRINSEGTKNVALACKAVDATLIYISTDFVFNGKKKKPYKENDKTHPLSVYADSKLKGEKAVEKVLKKYFILRTSWLYGKNGKNFVDTILKKAKEEKVLKVVDDQVGSPTYTVDLAEAIHALLNKSTRAQGHKSTGYGIYHVSNSGSVSWYEYAKKILKSAGSSTKIVPISSRELDRPARRPEMSILDNSKFIKFTGYKMQKWQEALKKYV